jgi:hypothetical protein
MDEEKLFKYLEGKYGAEKVALMQKMALSTANLLVNYSSIWGLHSNDILDLTGLVMFIIKMEHQGRAEKEITDIINLVGEDDNFS